MQEPLISVPQENVRDEDDPLYIHPTVKSEDPWNEEDFRFSVENDVTTGNLPLENISCDVDPSGIIPIEKSEPWCIYKCRDCSYNTRVWDEFVHHLTQCSPKELGRRRGRENDGFKCEYCNFQTQRKEVLKAHTRLHAVRNTCTKCGFIASTRPLLQQHVLSHANRFAFQCVLCKERLMGHKNFDYHMKVHLFKTSKCQWCNFTTDHQVWLKQHLQNHIETKKKYCTDCGYFCFYENDRRDHAQIHQHREGNESERSTIISSCSTQNKIEDNEKKIIDEKLTKIREKLQNKSHNQASTQLSKGFYKCTICDETERSEAGLVAHCERHVSPAVHTCPQCAFQTGNGQLMREHVLNHLPLVEMNAPDD